MAVEKITLNLIPTGETLTIHAAQFDKERAFQIELKEGEDDFSPTGYDIELQVRKVDNNIVTAIPSQVSGNIVTFLTTEQMTACSGTNLAELQISKNNMSIATLHFYLVVQRDVLAGGLSSQSEIYDLEEQIAAIVPEVIGDEYYTAEQVDEKIAEIPTFDPTNYYDKTQLYTKTETDALLNNKADKSNTYTKTETDSLLALKADKSDTYTKSETDALLALKVDKSELYNVYPTEQESGAIAHFTDGADNIPVKSLVSQIVAVETGSGEKSPDNPYTISGFSQGVITVTDNNQITNTYTFAFGQTVYGGHFDNKGNLVVTHIMLNFSDLTFDNSDPALHVFRGDYSGVYFSNLKFPPSGMVATEDFTERYVAMAWLPISPSDNGRFALNNYGTFARFAFIDYNYSTQADFEVARANDKIIVELANPITLSITSQDIPTLLGENNIYSNCGDVEVDYHADIGLYIDKKISSLAQA